MENKNSEKNKNSNKNIENIDKVQKQDIDVISPSVSISDSDSDSDSDDQVIPPTYSNNRKVHWVDTSPPKDLKFKNIPEIPYTKVPDVTYSPTAAEKAKEDREKTVVHRGITWKMKDKEKPEASSSEERIVESEFSLNGKMTTRIKLDPKLDPTSQTILDSVMPFTQEEDKVTTWPTNAIPIEELNSDMKMYMVAGDDSDLPKGSIVMHDVVVQYLESLAPGEEPKQIFVANPSESLRCIFPMINACITAEALTDTGSQIVSMSEKKGVEACLSWDPDVVVYMLSANKGIVKSLGLAKNVPFLFGEITVYLQVHIIRDPAYDVLLGRPFDTLTQSEIKNDKDGGATITIHDPNTHKRSIIPTYARGKGPTLVVKNPKATQGFLLASMN